MLILTFAIALAITLTARLHAQRLYSRYSMAPCPSRSATSELELFTRAHGALWCRQDLAYRRNRFQRRFHRLVAASPIILPFNRN